MAGMQEIARHELDNLTEQQQSLDTEIERLAEQSTELHTLYARQVNMFIFSILQDFYRQDELLKRIFGGDYGSPEENQLEETLDSQEELRNRIVEANFKWKQAQLMVDYSFKQLTEAVGRWDTLPRW